MTAAERFGAFLMTLGFSCRVSQLHAIDAAEYVGRHCKPHN